MTIKMTLCGCIPGAGLKAIDAFLTSLAVGRKTQAIGSSSQVLGGDGTEGLKSIKAEGGLTFVQDPETAHTPACPRAPYLQNLYFILPLTA
jgi:chemotaxis response regulator CheB